MKQKELAEKYGVTPMAIGKIRKKVCSDEDYCEDTKELTNFGVTKIEEYFKKKDDSILDPKLVKVQCLAPCLNEMFWECKLYGETPRKVIVAIPASHISSMRPHMVFKAQEIEKGGEKFYRHEIILQREINRQKRF
tara:strand:+ start:2817 stop:3224 length:408 start_codon:yes stop_codon:yes gene_type:complete